MKRVTGSLPLRALGVITAALLSACGGGGNVATPVTLSGNVIDGYITGATVCLDINGNGVCDSGEPSATTGTKGAYSLQVPVGVSTSNLHLIASIPAGAVDSDFPSTPIAAPYKMMAPADMPSAITPLTTAVSTHMIADGMNIANARIRARADLSLPIDYDFFKDHVATNDTKAHNVAKVMAAILSNSVGTSAPTSTNLAAALTEAKAYAAQTWAATSVAGLVANLGPAGGGFTRTCGTVATQNCLSFGEPTLALDGFEGLGSAAVVADPQNTANQVAKFVKVSTGQPWAGATVYTTASNKSVPSIGFAASKVITMRVLSNAVGETIRIKVEDASDGSKSMEVDAVTTKANQWETLTFDFAAPAAGSYSAATTYNKISIFPKFLTAVTTDTAYYFDELKFAKAPGNTGNCVTSASQNCLTFSEPTIALTPFGGASASVASDPLGSTNQVATFTKSPGNEVWAGVTIATTASDNSVARAGFDTSKIVTLRVLSPAAGQKIRLKFENSADPTKTIEVDATTTKANEWETLTFNFSTPAAGTAAYVSATPYNKVTVFPNFLAAATSDSVYYFDELSYAAYVAPPPPPATPTVLAFSSGFATDTATVEGGKYGGYSGSDLDGWNCTGGPAWCGSGSAKTTGANSVPAVDSAFYYYYQTPSAPPVGSYVGIFLSAPGLANGFNATANNTGLSINGQTSMTFKFAQNPEWFSSAGRNFAVILTTGTLYQADCHVKMVSVVTPTASDPTTYTLSLSSFKVIQDCGQAGVTNAATALSGRPISQIDFQADSGASALSDGVKSTGANTTVQVGGVYPTTLKVVGGITFQ